MRQKIFDTIIKEVKENSFEGRMERLYENHRDKPRAAVYKETLYPLVLAIGSSAHDPPEWALEECEALWQKFVLFGKPDCTGWLGDYPDSDPEKLCWAAIHFVLMSLDPTSGKPSIRAAIVRALGGEDKAHPSDIKRLERRWNADTNGEIGGYPDNRWIRRALEFLDVQNWYNSEAGQKFLEALTDSESEV